MGEMTEIVVKAEGVWKVFGDRADEAIKAVQTEGIGKPEVLERFACVVGVQDASFEVAARRNLLHHGAFGIRKIDAGAPHQPPD
jgi:ABC-type proline/glycine betaine transport system ATPase subunit